MSSQLLSQKLTVISFIYLPRYRISPILNVGSIDMLVFLLPPEVCSSVNHGPHSKKAFICHTKLGNFVLSILADSSGELPGHKKLLLSIVGYLSILATRVAIFFAILYSQIALSPILLPAKKLCLNLMSDAIILERLSKL